MRLVRHGRRTQRRAGSQTRWSRGYTAWRGSAGRPSVCRRRTAPSSLSLSLRLRLRLRPYRSIDLSDRLSLSSASERGTRTHTQMYISIVFFFSVFVTCPDRLHTHLRTHVSFRTKKYIYIYILLCVYIIRSDQPFFTHAYNVR